jgi:hypothetical protein
MHTAHLKLKCKSATLEAIKKSRGTASYLGVATHIKNEKDQIHKKRVQRTETSHF